MKLMYWVGNSMMVVANCSMEHQLRLVKNKPMKMNLQLDFQSNLFGLKPKHHFLKQQRKPYWRNYFRILVILLR